MGRLTNLPIALALVLAPAGAHAAESFECDTPQGRYSLYQRDLTAPPGGLSGRIEFKTMRRGNYGPVANIFFQDATDRTAGLRFVFPERSSRLNVIIRRPGSNGIDDRLLATIEAPESLNFDIAFTTAGELRVTAGADSATVPLPAWQPTRLALACSSINAEFADLVLR